MDRIAHFEILGQLGQGGMAVVYKARDVRLGRLVALKLLAPDVEAKEEARLRFLLEAKAVSALDHPNVCTLYEIGEAEDGRMFLAMAYIEGAGKGEGRAGLARRRGNAVPRFPRGYLAEKPQAAHSYRSGGPPSGLFFGAGRNPLEDVQLK